jgi:uncharacterized short protein YbdD (DUF466 family)
MKRVLHRAQGLWRGLRALLGDDAYERYLAHRHERHAGAPTLDRRDFYLSELERRWTRINRCC